MTIEKGIPIPNPGRRLKHNALRTDLGEMAVGDSILLPDVSQQYASSNAVRAGKLYGFVFTTRKTRDGIRVWRVE